MKHKYRLLLEAFFHAACIFSKAGSAFCRVGVDEDENACWASLACWIESGISTLLLTHVVVVPGGYCRIDEPTSIPHCSKQGRLSCDASQSYFP